jgi:hypothetical protein
MTGIFHREHEGDTGISLDERRTESGVERAVLFGPQPESSGTGTHAEVSPSPHSWHLHSRRFIILMSFCRPNQASSALVIFDDASFSTGSLRGSPWLPQSLSLVNLDDINLTALASSRPLVMSALPEDATTRSLDSRTTSMIIAHLDLSMIRRCENSLLSLMLFLGYPPSLDDIHSVFPTQIYSGLVARGVRMIMDASIEVWIPAQSGREG